MNNKKVTFDIPERKKDSRTTEYVTQNTNKARRSQSYKPICTPTVVLTGYNSSIDCKNISSYAQEFKNEYSLRVRTRLNRSFSENMNGRYKSNTGEYGNVGFEEDPVKGGDMKFMKAGSQSSSDDSGIALNNLCNKDKSPGIRFADSEEAVEMNDEMMEGEFKCTGRRKSHWGAYLQNVDMRRVMASGTFKLTLLQLARDGEADNLQLLMKSLDSQQCSRMLNTSTDEEGVTALHLAAKNNHYDVCKLFIDFGANINIKAGQSRATPLHFAARYRPKKKSACIATPDKSDNQISDRICATIQQPKSKYVIKLLSENGGNINAVDVEGQTPLHCATIKGNTPCVHQILGCKDVMIEVKDSQGMTALHMAATHGFKDIVHTLLEKGADLQSTDNDLMTPLHFACSEGNVEIVNLILNRILRKDPGSIKKMLIKVDAGKNTVLHIAVGKGHFDIVKSLISWQRNSGDVKQMINSQRSHGDSTLHIAAAQGHLEICETLADNGGDINIRNSNLATPVLLAAQHNNYKIVEFLIERGADIESRDKDNLTPLLLACKQGHLETLSWLIEHAADSSATDKHDKTCLMLAVEDHRTPAVHELLNYDCIQKLMDETDKNANSVLHIAARKGFLPIIKVLLDNGARIDPKNEDEATPLHIAAQFGQHITMKEILDHDKNTINALDENANTALHLASIEGHAKCVSILIESGANVGLRNTRQMTALDCACSKGWNATAVVLLQAQAAVNPLKGSRTTPLHEACLNGHVLVVKTLLEWRADVGAKIADGRNPLDCAIDQDHSDCVQAILAHDSWKNALRNAYIDLISGTVVTPVRKLVVKMPEMAEFAFSRSIKDNRKKWDDQRLEIELDFEFLDDMYTVTEWLHKGKEVEGELDLNSPEKDPLMSTSTATSPSVAFKGEHKRNKSTTSFVSANIAIPDDPASYEAFNDQGRLNAGAITYTTDTNMLRHNHPLMIMVTNKREGLLQHPVVTALLQYKWNIYGGMVYYTTLLFLLIFVLLLNTYMIMIPPPYTVDFLKSLANRRFHGEFTSGHITNYTAPASCYSLLKAGTNYRGFANITKSGGPCIPWADTNTDGHLYPDAGLEENYCRNPGSQLEMPWCFTNYSNNNPNYITREECNITMCNVFVRSSDVPKGTQCAFPFIYQNTEINKCLEHAEGKWCSATVNYDEDILWGFCTEESPYCEVPEELKKPCGSPGIDKLNCEARGCCYRLHDEGLPSEYAECFQKFDECSDWSSYCPIQKNAGVCETQPDFMAAICPKSCEFCNVSEETMDTERMLFLYLMSIYPNNTFDPDWKDGCYYCLQGAQKKWGDGCLSQKNWELPIKITLLVICVFNILRLILQIWNYQLEAFRPIFFLELILYTLCILLAIDLNAFDLEYTRQMLTEKELYDPLVLTFQKETGIRQNWQWQCGVMALFLSWMDLLLYIQKIPYLGIYVVMFNDVFKTFIKFSLVFLLFIFSFAFTFHTLLQNEVEFEFPFQSILKTTVMMVGELDFTGIFLGGSEEYAEKVNYIIVTYIIFSIFIIVMMIIIMNLLVGLAVGDIMAVQEHATLERLKMQVELALEVEFAVPNVIRKRFVRQYAMIEPNKYRGSNWLKRAVFEDKVLSTKNIANVMNPSTSETEEIQECVQELVIIVRELKLKTHDHDAALKELLAETREMKSTIDETADIQQQRINLEDEDKSRSSKKDRRKTQEPKIPDNEPLPAFLRSASFRRDRKASGRRLRASNKRRIYKSETTLTRSTDDEMENKPTPQTEKNYDEHIYTASPTRPHNIPTPAITLEEFDDTEEFA